MQFPNQINNIRGACQWILVLIFKRNIKFIAGTHRHTNMNIYLYIYLYGMLSYCAVRPQNESKMQTQWSVWVWGGERGEQERDHSLPFSGTPRLYSIPPLSLPILNLSTKSFFNIFRIIHFHLFISFILGLLSNKIKFYCRKMLREIVAATKWWCASLLLPLSLPRCGWFGLLCWLFNLFKFKFVCLSLSPTALSAFIYRPHCACVRVCVCAVCVCFVCVCVLFEMLSVHIFGVFCLVALCLISCQKKLKMW